MWRSSVQGLTSAHTLLRGHPADGCGRQREHPFSVLCGRMGRHGPRWGRQNSGHFWAPKTRTKSVKHNCCVSRFWSSIWVPKNGLIFDAFFGSCFGAMFWDLGRSTRRYNQRASGEGISLYTNPTFGERSVQYDLHGNDILHRRMAQSTQCHQRLCSMQQWHHSHTAAWQGSLPYTMARNMLVEACTKTVAVGRLPVQNCAVSNSAAATTLSSVTPHAPGGRLTGQRRGSLQSARRWQRPQHCHSCLHSEPVSSIVPSGQEPFACSTQSSAAALHPSSKRHLTRRAARHAAHRRHNGQTKPMLTLHEDYVMGVGSIQMQALQPFRFAVHERLSELRGPAGSARAPKSTTTPSPKPPSPVRSNTFWHPAYLHTRQDLGPTPIAVGSPPALPAGSSGEPAIRSCTWRVDSKCEVPASPRTPPLTQAL